MFTSKGRTASYLKFGAGEKIEALKNETQQFCVKCLGSAVLPNLAMDSCETAVRKVIDGGNIYNSMYVSVRMSVANGIETFRNRNEPVARYDIRRIPFCFVSDQFPSIFAFLYSEDDQTSCNVFQCSDEIEASTLYLEMSKTFKSAQQVEKYEDRQREARLSGYDESKSGNGGGNGPTTVKRRFKRYMSGGDDASEADGLMDD